ncbi:uncharacterized protein LOC125811652 [Solanum verrucosum]|uniref:uncharacterized protein LOC125811652 n=1 Tax=Solanum verrucosum TaxID=315347 RepID=UPI0020D0C0F8|nr:uncharacterized protein LOC125811652 [Solanum verrucosum]
MQMVESRFRMKKKSQKMTLEKYVDFIDSNKQFDLTIPNLNEIISIHGFKKSKRQKKVLADAVNTIELMDLQRSTLQEEISSEAFVTLDEAIKDLTHLNWQECCVTSLQTICFSNGVNGSDHCQAKTNASASSMPNIPPPTKTPKVRSVKSCYLE